jgi:hypothetical protein
MATGDGKTQGDASTSPFGNGGGNTAGGNMAGNNFLTNPGGSKAGGAGADFLTNPSGAGPTGAKPLNVVDPGMPQKKGEPVDLNKPSEIRDGGGLVPLLDRPDAGAGSIGNARKPFKGI